MSIDKLTNIRYCIYIGRVQNVKLLLENGADKNLRDNNGETALTLAEKEYSQKGDEDHKQIVDILKGNTNQK